MKIPSCLHSTAHSCRSVVSHLLRFALAVYLISTVILSPASADTTAGVEPSIPANAFTDDYYTSYPTFNVDPHNPEIGDEISFVRISNRFEGRKLRDYRFDGLKIAADEVYDLLVCCHNAADPALGDAGTARDVTLYLHFPQSCTDGTNYSIYAQLASTTTTPSAVSDFANFRATDDFELTAENIIASRYTLDGEKISDLPLEFTRGEDGTLYASAQLGDIASGEDNAEFIFVAFQPTSTAAPDRIKNHILASAGVLLVLLALVLIVTSKLKPRHG